MRVLDRWNEILETLGRNRLRTAMTMLSVAWGIFMLVLLLGAGKGLQNAVRWQFRDDATNSVWVYRGQTSRPFEGHGVGRSIRFDNDDHASVAAMPGVEHITSRYYLRGEFTISYLDRNGAFSVRACHPDHQFLENTDVVEGRYLDDLDLAQRRKVTVIGREVAKQLFRGESALGKWITINGIQYKVVGVFEDVGGIGEMRQVYIPITTAQTAYGGGDEVHQIMFTVGDATVEESEELSDRVRLAMAKKHHFDPEDQRAVRVRNNLEQAMEILQIFDWLGLFVWLVGLGTVAAGIIGVSNIMLVSVRERTTELGLRKAIGATPSSIVLMIVEEAVALTAVSGYLGLVAGLAIIELVRRVVPENDYLRDPTVDLSTVVIATVLLVVFGALAGFVPAWRAARIHPVEALRDA